MFLFADAVVVDESGRVLLIRRDDSRTWAPPGGSIEQDETPAEGVVREVEEETGLKVLPVRLVGVYFLPERRASRLAFLFRCLQRGGNLRPSPEAPQLGFADPAPLPRPMLNSHRQRLERGLAHEELTAFWRTQRTSPLVHRLRDLYYGLKNISRRLTGAVYVPPPSWRLTTAVVAQTDEGAVIWRRQGERQHLPGGPVAPTMAPWEAAVTLTQAQTGVTVTLNRLAAVYTLPNAHMHFLFTATVSDGVSDGAGGSAQDIPANVPANERHWLQTALAATGPTQFFKQDLGPNAH